MTSREWDAGTYHRVSAPQLRWGEALLATVDLDGTESAVDAGCGTGRLTTGLLARLPRGRVVGLDLSMAMLRTARDTVGTAGGRFATVQADLLALPLAPASVDLVLSTATFHWVLDHERLFAGIARVLRPGGRLVAQCGGRGNIERAHGHARAVAADPRWGGAFDDDGDRGRGPWLYAGAEETVDRLRAAGLAGEAGLHEEPTPFPDAAAYAEFMAAVVLRPWLGRLATEGDRHRFTAMVTERAGADDPRWTLDYVRLTMRATRQPD